MKKLVSMAVLGAMMGGFVGLANAGHDSDTAALFHKSNQSAEFFTKSYGYALFPTIVKGGVGIGAAHGTGELFAHGHRLGHVTMTQVSVGAQLGGEGYSEIIFFRDQQALDDFKSGNFEFSADAGAVAITAAADVSVGTTGLDTSASADKRKADASSAFNHGVAVFTIAKGGLMYNVTVAGQKFSYRARTAA
jgi:lipid-binding SYLF domain-containing protein